MKKYTYVRLLDKENFGTIVRYNKDHSEPPEVQMEKAKWVASSIMLGYTTDISPTYDMYGEITEDLALKYLEE